MTFYTLPGQPSDVLRIKTAGSTAQKTNVGNGLGNRRVLTGRRLHYRDGASGGQ